MELRKIRTEAEARRALAAMRDSGLPRPLWARANGISPRSLNAWRLNLDRRGRRDPASPLRLVELTTPVPVVPAYVVVVGDVRVELDDGFRDETVRRLVAVLRSC